MKLYSDNYLSWVKENSMEGLTRSQHEFAEFLLDNYKKVGSIGSMDDIFTSIRKFIKYSPEFNSKINSTIL